MRLGSGIPRADQRGRGGATRSEPGPPATPYPQLRRILHGRQPDTRAGHLDPTFLQPRTPIGTGPCEAPALAMVHLRSNQKVGFCFDGSAALKKTGRFLLRWSPLKKKGGFWIWPKEASKTTSGTRGTRRPASGGLRTTSRTSSTGRKKSATSPNSRSAKRRAGVPRGSGPLAYPRSPERV